MALLQTLLGPTAARADILVAVAGPVDGRNSARGTAMFSAVRERAARINAAGGVNGRKLTVISVNDGCAAGPATAAAESIVARKVALVLGHPCESAALAAAGVYGSRGTVFIATDTRHPRMTKDRAGLTIFRLSGREDAQGEVAGHWLAGADFGATVAIVHDRTLYARAIADGAAKTYRRETGREPVIATIVGGDKDYPLTSAKVKDAARIHFAGFPLEAGLLYSGLREAGSMADFLASDSIVTEEFAATFGTRAKGVKAIVATDPASNGVDDFAAMRTAAALSIFVAAARESGATDAASVAAKLASRTYVSEIGPVAFSSVGDALIASHGIVAWDGAAWRPPIADPK